MSVTTDALVETWRIHNRINLYLLDGVADEGLPAASASKGRTVGEQFAHMHNVRLMWLKAAAPALLANLTKVDKTDPLTRAALTRALVASGDAVASLVETSANGDGRVKGFKPHVVAFLGYLVSHESHHRGQIALTLKQAGLPLNKPTATACGSGASNKASRGRRAWSQSGTRAPEVRARHPGHPGSDLDFRHGDSG